MSGSHQRRECQQIWSWQDSGHWAGTWHQHTLDVCHVFRSPVKFLRAPVQRWNQSNTVQLWGSCSGYHIFGLFAQSSEMQVWSFYLQLNPVFINIWFYLKRQRIVDYRWMIRPVRVIVNRVRSSQLNSWQTMLYLFHDIICLPWIRILCSVPEWHESSRITMVSTPIKTTSLKFMEQQMFTLQKTVLDKSWGPTDDC